MRTEALQHRTPFRLLLGFILVASGCGEEERPTIYPVSGKVLVDGKPAAKVLITFHPATGPPDQVIPYAETDANGAFRPSTLLSGDGAPAGDYTLTILWPEIKIDKGEEISGRDRLGGRYRNLHESKLKVTIKEGENTLPPLELKSSR